MENQDKIISDVMSKYFEKKFNGIGENISSNLKKTEELLQYRRYDMSNEAVANQQIQIKKKTAETTSKKNQIADDKFKKHVAETLTKLQQTSTKLQSSISKEISLLDKQLNDVKHKKEIDSKKHNLLNVMSGDVTFGRYLGKKLHNAARKTTIYNKMGGKTATKAFMAANNLKNELSEKGVFKTIRDRKLNKKYRDEENKILKQKHRSELKLREEQRRAQIMGDRTAKLEGRETSRASTEQRLNRVRKDRAGMMRGENTSFRNHQSSFIRDNHTTPEFADKYKRSMAFTVNAAGNKRNSSYLGKVDSLLRKKAGLDPLMNKALGQTKFTQMTFKTDADILKSTRETSKSMKSIDTSTKQIAMYLKPKQDTSISATRGKLFGSPEKIEANLKKKEEKKEEKKTGLLGKMLKRYIGRKLSKWGAGKKGLRGKLARGLGSMMGGDCCCDSDSSDSSRKNKKKNAKRQRRIQRLKDKRKGAIRTKLKGVGSTIGTKLKGVGSTIGTKLKGTDTKLKGAKSTIGTKLKGAGKMLSKMPKLPVIGALIGVGLAADAYASSNNNAERKDAVGTAAGSTIGGAIGGAIGVLGGPIGVIAGAAIGSYLGEKIGGAIANKLTSPKDSIPDSVKGNPFREHAYLINVYIPDMVEKYKATTDKKEKAEIVKTVQDAKKDAISILMDDNVRDWIIKKIKDAGLDKSTESARAKFALKLVEKERKEYQDIVIRVIKREDFKNSFKTQPSRVKKDLETKGTATPVIQKPKQATPPTSSLSSFSSSITKTANNMGDTKLGTMIGDSSFGKFLNKTSNFLSGNGFKTDTGTYGSGKFAGVDGTPTSSDDTGKKPIVSIEDYGPGWNVVKRADGSVEKRKGTRNWRNNNPGNIVYGDFAKSLGAIGSDGRFAIFPTYAQGRAAKQKLIFSGKNYAGLSLTDAIARYAPPNENNTAMYQRTILAAVGGKNAMMSQFNGKEQIAIMNAMQKVEGFKMGSAEVMKGGETSGTSTTTAAAGGAATAISKPYNKATEGVDAKTLKQDGQSMSSNGGKNYSSATSSTPSSGGGGGGFVGKVGSFLGGVGSSIASAASTAGNYVGIAADKIKSFLGHGFKTQSGVNYQGMNQGFKKKFEMMSADYKAKTGKDILITSGYRSIAEQAHLYNTKPPGMAAKPGSSLHNFGWAMDINTPDANALEQMGLMQKYGFHRPLLSKGETWHIEPVGIDKQKIKSDPKYAKDMEKSLTSQAVPGGAGAVTMSPAKIATEGVDNKTLAMDAGAKKTNAKKPVKTGGSPSTGASVKVTKNTSNPTAPSAGADSKELVQSSNATKTNQSAKSTSGTNINNTVIGGNSSKGKQTGVSNKDFGNGKITDPAFMITTATS